MREFLERIAEFAYEYGVKGAGMASIRGNYELPVPQELVQGEEE